MKECRSQPALHSGRGAGERYDDAAGSGEDAVLGAAESFAAIPGVEVFELLVEVSPKNDYCFGISMEFADRIAYERYNTHPDHVRFVQERWLPEVTDFLEIDYAAR